jgi:NitT/TauT family transport system permease protein
VNLALLIGALWTIPAGVAIGFNPRLARIAQPLAQIAASVPATALLPVILLLLIRIGGGLGLASIIVLLLGTQWYVLFNVIAGAMAIPTDLKECCSIFHVDGLQRWRKLILPGIFPYLVTGLVTASGEHGMPVLWQSISISKVISTRQLDWARLSVRQLTPAISTCCWLRR